MEPNEQLDSRSDLDLIADLNAGDVAAFDALYFRYRDWVVNLAFRFTNDHDLALDVLQEVFLYFHQKFPGFRLTAQLKTFLYPAVRNLSLTAKRKTERVQSSEAELAHLESASTVDPEAGALEPLEAALATLSAEHREVLMLRFVDGLALNEISVAMDIPLGTVKSRLHNALDTLRRHPRTRRLFDT